MMAVCAGYKRDGSRCTVTVEPPQTHCWWHDPDNTEARRRAASKGGKGKASRELPQVKTMLKDLTERVLSGELETGRAAVANQLINTRLRAIEQERKVRELEDVLVRIEALEEKQRQSQPMKGARRW